MSGKLWRLGVLAAAVAAVVGCKTHTPTATPPRTHPDPLCITKKPVEGRQREGEPEAVVRVDPQPPPIPAVEGGTLVRPRVPLGVPRPVEVGLRQGE